MKKLSRLLSFISGAALVISTTASLTAGAETEKTYTYSEIMAMSDEELLEKSDYGMYYEFYEFENMTDDEKYRFILGGNYS